MMLNSLILKLVPLGITLICCLSAQIGLGQTLELDLDAIRWPGLAVQKGFLETAYEDSSVLQMMDLELVFLAQELKKQKSLLESEDFNLDEYQGHYSAEVFDPVSKLTYLVSFTDRLDAMVQVTRFGNDPVLADRTNRLFAYRMTLHEGGGAVRSFSRFDNKVTLNFYESGLLENCGVISDGWYFWSKWDEDGKLVASRKSILD